jgi:Zn-dependent protease
LDLVALGHALSVWLIPIVTAITMHEAAHGWMAARLGDDTAQRLGRVTINPLRHVDPFGTLLLPGLMLLASGGQIAFGWAKPVPVDLRRLRRPKRDMIWVALAGPGINVILATLATLVLLGLVIPLGSGEAALWVATNLSNAVWANLLLAIFNMIPIPPLDGGRIVTGLLPMPLARRFARLEPYGLVTLLLVLLVLPVVSGALGHEIHPVGDVLLGVAQGAVDTLCGRPCFLLTGS